MRKVVTKIVERAQGILYKAIVLLVLLYGRKIWGGDMGHAKSTRGITSSGRQTYCGDDGVAYDVQVVQVALGG